jgi:hypothetical protein
VNDEPNKLSAPSFDLRIGVSDLFDGWPNLFHQPADLFDASIDLRVRRTNFNTTSRSRKHWPIKRKARSTDRLTRRIPLKSCSDRLPEGAIH